ncbi:MAG: hypothetical protein ACI9V8_000416 [Urechidicola sp.]|jgi:hypothetical protein
MNNEYRSSLSNAVNPDILISYNRRGKAVNAKLHDPAFSLMTDFYPIRPASTPAEHQLQILVRG